MLTTDKIIYISGSITKEADIEVARKNFEAAEMHFKSKGYTVFNPFIICAHLEGTGASWIDYMAVCMPYVLKSKAIYMLRNWGISDGARVEYVIAIERRLEILFQS